MREIKLQAAMKAVIMHQGKVLLLRESTVDDTNTQQGKYQFPGGRVEPGEHFRDALLREVREETGMEVEIIMPIYVGEWRPVIKGVQHQIIATFFLCRPLGDPVVHLSSEHDDFAWVEASERGRYNIAPADDEVIATYAALAAKGVIES